MTGRNIRQKFLDYFAGKGHTIVPSSSLVPLDDPSVLLTTAGMQQFKPYFLGKKSPWGNKVVSVQKAFRTSDIEEVGDETHLTFFEMLGNFSFNYPKGKGSYFKEEAIKLGLEFIEDVLGIERKRISVSVFGGDREVPLDTDSIAIWQKLGFASPKIKRGGREENFWGPTGKEGPCGPTAEIIIDGIETWNLVFNEYYSDANKKLTKLQSQGVDTGMGLDRLAVVVQGKRNVYETDLFSSIIDTLKNNSFPRDLRVLRIMADHLRAATFLIADNVTPSNKEQGYVLRRLLRRSLILAKERGTTFSFEPTIEAIVKEYGEAYPELVQKRSAIVNLVSEEAKKFSKTIDKGMKEFTRLAEGKKISGDDVFKLYETHGFPLEITVELAKERKLSIDHKEVEVAKKRHQETSRQGAAGKFGGHGLLSSSGKIVGGTSQEKKRILRMHTATHLLHQALRDVFGDTVQQKGSDITGERLRFDFSHKEKLSPEEIKKVESIVHQKIKDDLPVYRKEMSQEDAHKTGALAFFKDKYGGTVSVYFIGAEDPVKAYSKEFCAGPHVSSTQEVGQFRIIREEAVGAGVRRIRAKVT